MGFLSEIKKKSSQSDSPEITLTSSEVNRLKNGQVIVTNDAKGNSYLIKVKKEKQSSDAISQDDLEIEKLQIPIAARDFPNEL